MLSIATLSPIYAKLREPVPIITPITVARTLFFTPLVTNIKMAEIAMQSSHLSSSVTIAAPTLPSSVSCSIPVADIASTPKTLETEPTTRKIRLCIPITAYLEKIRLLLCGI